MTKDEARGLLCSCCSCWPRLPRSRGSPSGRGGGVARAAARCAAARGCDAAPAGCLCGRVASPDDPATLSELGRFAEAAPLLRRAADVLDDGVSHYNLALLLARTDRVDEAIGEHRRTLERAPADVPTRGNLAAAYVRLGDLDAAMSCSACSSWIPRTRWRTRTLGSCMRSEATSRARSARSKRRCGWIPGSSPHGMRWPCCRARVFGSPKRPGKAGADIPYRQDARKWLRWTRFGIQCPPQRAVCMHNAMRTAFGVTLFGRNRPC